MSEQKTQPRLSVCVIFKNEIRCLERCLKSFQPLKAKAPVEIVMADTGSTDGSRAVAERYADTLFDFPWIDDFAAARNAVLDRCKGVWALTVDADEWLDADDDELAALLRSDGEGFPDKGLVVIRNYQTEALDDEYGEFTAPRLLRLAARPRYKGAIHELPVFPGEAVEGGSPAFAMNHTLLHHDGYVNFGTEKGKAKRERNLALIRVQLAEDPDNLSVLLHFLNSGGQEPDFVDRLRHTVKLVRGKAKYWDTVGPPLLRQAVVSACERKLPEREEWAALARKMFPNSIFTRIDVNYTLALRAAAAGDYAECLRLGEAYFKACERMETDRKMREETAFSLLQNRSASSRRSMLLAMAGAHARLEQPERAARLLEGLGPAELNGEQTGFALRTLYDMRLRGGWDTGALVTALWAGASEPVPDGEKMEARKAGFLQSGAAIFTEKPETEPGREPWTLFLPLEGKGCPLGDAAAMMDTEDSERLTELLCRQEAPADFPAGATAHAFKHGVRFPLPGRALNVEEIDALAAALDGEKPNLHALVKEIDVSTLAGDRQALLWARALTLTALRSFDWKRPEDEKIDGLALLRMFAAVEERYLPRCYTREALDDPHALPPVHRFGVRLIRALDALDAEDYLESVRALRAALSTCKDMKPAVEFLLKQVRRMEREHAVSAASPELKKLAEQVRAILAAYPPDDPNVAALKNSEAYQKVAYLLE